MALDDRGDPGPSSGPPKYPGAFLLAFREAAADLSWQVQRWRGHFVECVDERGHSHTVGLENLYRLARRRAREDWPRFIAEFLGTAATATEAPNLPKDLATVADQLLVRLGPRMAPTAKAAGLWEQPLGNTGLYLSLVVDYADRMCYVTEELISGSGRPADEWLNRALTNLRARTPAGSLELLDAESGVWLSAVGDAYDSSRALVLDTLIADAAADGCFVAVPGRDMLLVLPVSWPAMSFVHLLKVLAAKEFKGTPYPISDEVFWVRAGVWRSFPIEIKATSATANPPDEFNEVLKRLMPKDYPESTEHEPTETGGDR